MATQHEAMHHHFNTYTSCGNALALLNQLGAAARAHKIGHDALVLAREWNDACAFWLEGAVSYVAFKRAVRRDPSVTIKAVEGDMSGPYRQAWAKFRAVYDELPVSDASQDTLAVLVSQYCFTLDVYPSIRDFRDLRGAIPLVTDEIVAERFNACHNLLGSAVGRRFCEDYDRELERRWESAPDRGMVEQAYAYDFLQEKLPNLAHLAPERIPDSIELANHWNSELVKMGLEDAAKISISLRPGARPMDQDVAILPPAPRLRNLNLIHLTNVAEFDKLVGDDWVGALFYEHAGDESFVLSNKYARSLNPGQVYVRFHRAHLDDEKRTVHLAEDTFFAITTRQQLAAWIARSENPRLIWIDSWHASDFESMMSTPDRGRSPYWRIIWARTPEQVETWVRAHAERLAWVDVGVHRQSQVGHLLAFDGARRILFDFPISAAAVEALSTRVPEGVSRGRNPAHTGDQEMEVATAIASVFSW